MGLGCLASVSTSTTGTPGSVGPAGRTIFGFFLPGFQPTLPSVMWKRRLNASPSSVPAPKESFAGASASCAFLTASAIFDGSSAAYSFATFAPPAVRKSARGEPS
jgi:hypothetical protein